MIGKINKINFEGVNKYSSHTPKAKPYSEGYFMQKSPLAKDYKPVPNFTERLITLINKIAKRK